MIQEYRRDEYNTCTYRQVGNLRNLPLGEDIKSLFLGISAFSKRDKEILGAEEGYYKVVVEEGNLGSVTGKLCSSISILITDTKRKRTYRAKVGTEI